MIVRLIHGIHSPEGNNNMSALLPHMRAALSDTKVELFSYGFMGFWRARWSNDGVAKRLASMLKLNVLEDEVWITHSNGGAIAYLACTKFGAKPKAIINVNPALDRWLSAPVDHVLTIHSDGDRAVWLSQWLPFHIWGDQGHVGYRGFQKNTRNVNASEFLDIMRYHDHCGAFSSIRIGRWASFFAQFIREISK